MLAVKRGVSKLQSNTMSQDKDLPLTSLHESIFWDEDDPRWKFLNADPKYLAGIDFTDHFKPGHDVNMGSDSYIWCFTGVRGAGKSISMAYFALKCNWLYGLRLISNYPIECKLNLMNGKSRIVRAEPLDLYRLLCFDADYHDCLILIDEAPDIISHMASMSWKNRLLNIFVRQLRKNHNSLFLGAQQFELIDKSMRWQTDVIAACQDASRKYGWGADYRGESVLMRLMDNSGMWTGTTYNEAVRRQENLYNHHFEDPALKLMIYPRVLWGEKGVTKPVYDTYYTMDVWESLRKVDMRLQTYQVGDKGEKQAPEGSTEVLARAAALIDQIKSREGQAYYQKDFWAAMGPLSTAEKDFVAKRMSSCNSRIGQAANGKRFYQFLDFDKTTFLGN